MRLRLARANHNPQEKHMRDSDWLLVHVDIAVAILREHPRTSREYLERRLRLSRPEMNEVCVRLWRMGVTARPLT